MNMARLQKLDEWLKATEGETLEFKEAKSSYSFDKLAKYASALANEGGGKIIFGVSDKRPRQVVGTGAFQQPEETRKRLNDALKITTEFIIIGHDHGRVLVFVIPPHPVGTPVDYKGTAWMRENDSLIPLSEDRRRRIYAEVAHDFSADVCPGLQWEDLDLQAIEEFRQRWIDKSGNGSLANLTPEQLLQDADAVTPNGITYAALVLFGTRHAVRQHLAQAEVIFEYRSSDASGPAQDRESFQEGFFLYYDRLWNKVNLRNDVQHYQDGLFIINIPTFAERPIREVILNAVSHRNYQMPGNIWVRQYPRRMECQSPGGLPIGVTLGNILHRQSPRNRRIAELFEKCGLVERAGQGMDLMFTEAIRESKATPSFEGTDDYTVVVTLNGEVQDLRFLKFLEKVGLERLEQFSTADFLTLDLIRRNERVPDTLKPYARRLRELGIVESVGGKRHLLARRLYQFLGQSGRYTRERGLDRETNKELLLKHIRDSRTAGAPLQELVQVLPNLSEEQVRYRLKLLHREERAVSRGRGRGARWYTPEHAPPP